MFLCMCTSGFDMLYDCVAYNRKALSPHCVVELLRYTNSKVLLDIRGHHFNYITRKHCDAFKRIKRVEDYQHMLC